MLGKKFIIFFILVSIAVTLRIKVYDINKIVDIDVSAKKDINPDVVILKIQFLQNGNDFNVIHTNLNNQTEKIKTYLKTAKISDDFISKDNIDITDRKSDMDDCTDKNCTDKYISEIKKFGRYEFKTEFFVKSNDIKLIENLYKNKSKIGGNNLNFSIDYKLMNIPDSIQTEMLGIAAKNALKIAKAQAKKQNLKLTGLKSIQQECLLIKKDKINPKKISAEIMFNIKFYAAPIK